MQVISGDLSKMQMKILNAGGSTKTRVSPAKCGWLGINGNALKVLAKLLGAVVDEVHFIFFHSFLLPPISPDKSFSWVSNLPSPRQNIFQNFLFSKYINNAFNLSLDSAP